MKQKFSWKSEVKVSLFGDHQASLTEVVNVCAGGILGGFIALHILTRFYY